MDTKKALEAISGRSWSEDDGLLAPMRRELVAAYDQAEEERLDEAERRNAARSLAPHVLRVEKRLAEARGASYLDENAPFVTRHDAMRVFRDAHRAAGSDPGLRMVAAHTLNLWHEDANGALTVGDVTRLKAHYKELFPRSRVASVIDQDLVKVSFLGLDTRKLAHLSREIVGKTPEARQASYEEVVTAHGLTSERPEHRRARAYLRELVRLAQEEQEPMAPRDMTSEDLVDRIADSYIDGADLEIEDGVVHHEDTEVVEETVSPNSGEPLAIELGEALSPEESAEVLEDDADLLLEEAEELEDMAGADLSLDEAEALGPMPHAAQLDDAGDGLEDMGDLADFGPSELVMDDPTMPGAKVRVTLEAEPAPGEAAADLAALEDEAVGALESDEPGEDEDVESFGVFLDNEDEPLEQVQARSMRHVLQHVAAKLEDAQGGLRRRTQRVFAAPSQFERVAFVDLGDGHRLRIQASDLFDSLANEAPATGQPVVQHHLDIDPDEIADVLTDEIALNQTAPKAVQAAKVCAQLGLTAAKVESEILAGRPVVAGRVRIEIDDQGEVALYRGGFGRAASMQHIGRVVSDFLSLVSQESLRAHRRRIAMDAPGEYIIKPLFSVDCVQCGSPGEYEMPDQPQDAICPACGCATPAEAVAIQLEIKQAQVAFPGCVIHVDVPGNSETRKLNAKRMLKALQKVVKTAGAKLHGRSLEVVARRVSQADVARVRRVLEDVFGARSIHAQLEPTDPVNPQGQPTQHMTTPAAPGPQMPNQPETPQTTETPAVQAAGDLGARCSGAQRRVQAQELNPEALDEAIDAVYPESLDDAVPVEGAPGADGLMDAPVTPPGVMPGGEDIEHAHMDEATEETIHAAMIHYRNTGVGIAEAAKAFVNTYRRFLDRFGDETSAARHLAEAAVIRVAKEVYERPATAVMPVPKRQAAKPKVLKPGTVWKGTEQKGDLPKMKVRKDRSKSMKVDWAEHAGAESKDVGNFDIKPAYDSEGHIQSDTLSWGRSQSDLKNLWNDKKPGK